MRLTTLCYIEHQGRYLMLNRNKKAVDENAGKWIGIGGHLEADEAPQACIRREALEETGLSLQNLRLRGILTFILPDWGNELSFLYTAESDTDTVGDCREGVLAWVPVEDIDRLPLWAGDRLFLPLLRTRAEVFDLKLVYAPGGALVEAVLDGESIPLPEEA